MHVILINAAGTRTEHDFATIEQAMGDVGPMYPIVCDGRAGHLGYGPTAATEPRFIETDAIFQYFSYAHLPEHLQAVSRWFYDLAEQIVLTLPRNAERTVALRKLLESKDAAVRARLAK